MQITIQGQHQIQLQSLKQSFTYAGLLEGLPTRARNDELLRRIVRDNPTAFDGFPAYLIEPVQTPYPPEVADDYPFGTPMKLPSICCIAQFQSYTPARDANADFSLLTIIWFQQTWALPIDEQVVEVIKQLPWIACAWDGIY